MFSIALCTYNGSKYLREQLESLAAQTLKPVELVLGDDGSTDDTLAILERFGAIPVSITRNSTRLGFAENFIQTALRCRSEWIAFCDQDDIWEPTKLQRCAGLIGKDVKLVAHSARMFGAEERSLPGRDKTFKRLARNPLSIWAGYQQVFHRDLIHRISPAHRNLPWRGKYFDAHDAWIPFVASAVGTVVETSEPLVSYRRHESNTTGPNDDVWAVDGDPLLQAAQMLRAIDADPEMRGLLLDAASHYEKVAKRVEAREHLSLGGFVKLVCSGAYRSGDYGTFGKRGMVSDLLKLI